MRRGLWRRRPRRLRRLLALALVVFAIAWLFGFYRFNQLIPEPGQASSRVTDAIVVLTGGAGRVREGLKLLDDGFAGKLFISGVHGGVDAQALLRVARQAPGNLECCIVIDHAAHSTRSNARETAKWVQKEGYKSLRLVTANYHMPRSLLEFRNTLPADIEIEPHPVFPEGFHANDWLPWRGSGRLVISEYHKFVAAMLNHGAGGSWQ